MAEYIIEIQVHVRLDSYVSAYHIKRTHVCVLAVKSLKLI